MRIIYDKSKENIVKCPKCGSIFIYNNTDLKSIESSYYLKCPCCDYDSDCWKFKDVSLVTDDMLTHYLDY